MEGIRPAGSVHHLTRQAGTEFRFYVMIRFFCGGAASAFIDLGSGVECARGVVSDSTRKQYDRGGIQMYRYRIP